jgi:ribonucleoside-diphosphate reductase alpha chain
MASREGLSNDRVLGLIMDKDSVQGIGSIPEQMREIFVTAHDIEPRDQVRMQAVFQGHVDNAVSKTINLPESSTVDDVRSIFHLAHELRCKGITVYREGTKPGQVYTAGGRGVECATCGQLV